MIFHTDPIFIRPGAAWSARLYRAVRCVLTYALYQKSRKDVEHLFQFTPDLIRTRFADFDIKETDSDSFITEP
jgi:hypothetical protein